MSENKITAPLSLTPHALEAGDEPAIAIARTSLAEAAHAAQQLCEAVNATTNDPSLTPSQAKLKCSRLSEQLSMVISKRLDDSRNAIAHQLTVIEAGPAWHPPKATTANAISVERDVAATLRHMSAEERMSTITTAIRDNDTVVLAALANGPAFLTATKPEARAALLGAWRAKHSTAWARHQKLKAAATRVDQAGKATIAWIHSLSADGGVSDLASKAEAARSAALDTVKAG